MGEVTALNVRERSAFSYRDQSISFGPFRLLPSQRLLLKNEEPVQLGGRALDILSALTARAGEPVPNGDLITAVWGGAAIEESNLKVHISALRKALRDGREGHRYIVHIPRNKELRAGHIFAKCSPANTVKIEAVSPRLSDKAQRRCPARLICQHRG
jgi:hypothetical protein